MTSGTFSLADRPYIVEQLHTKVLEVDFVKRDGTQRTMKCTLRADMLPVPDKPVIDTTKPERKDNPEVVAVYDLEAKDWRSFRIDSIQSITFRSQP